MNPARRLTAVPDPAAALAVPAGVRSLPSAPLPWVQSEALPPWARRGLTGGVVLVHLLGAWALLQVDAVRQAVVQRAPIMVDLLSPPAPTPPVPPPPSPPQTPTPKLRPVAPPLIAAPPTPANAQAISSPPEPVAPPQPVAVAAASVVAPAPPPAPPAPPAIKQVPAGAVRYLVEPKLVVPVLSRRAGEQGLVHLRVVVDAKGKLREASLKKSSGFARLDSQALLDIRSARFAPQTENGQPVEWETTALLSYELDN